MSRSNKTWSQPFSPFSESVDWLGSRSAGERSPRPALLKPCFQFVELIPDRGEVAIQPFDLRFYEHSRPFVVLRHQCKLQHLNPVEKECETFPLLFRHFDLHFYLSQGTPFIGTFESAG